MSYDHLVKFVAIVLVEIEIRFLVVMWLDVSTWLTSLFGFVDNIILLEAISLSSFATWYLTTLSKGHVTLLDS